MPVRRLEASDHQEPLIPILGASTRPSSLGFDPRYISSPGAHNLDTRPLGVPEGPTYPERADKLGAVDALLYEQRVATATRAVKHTV